MFPKKKQKKDKEILNYIKSLSCMACGKSGPSDAHHLKHQGAGGSDTISNCVALCRTDHTLYHAIGPIRFMEKYPRFKERLINLGWVIEDGKLKHFGDV